MWVIWAKQLLPQALKGCPTCNKSPNLVTLLITDHRAVGRYTPRQLSRKLSPEKIDGLITSTSSIKNGQSCHRHFSSKFNAVCVLFPGLEIAVYKNYFPPIEFPAIELFKSIVNRHMSFNSFELRKYTY